MAVITMLSAGGSPGVTTTVTALATQWPGTVLVVDADPQGGDILPGFLGPWWVDEQVHSTRGITTFVYSTRKLASVPAEALAQHIQPIPHTTHAQLLAGLPPYQRSSLTDRQWLRLASAVRDLTRHDGPDILIDAGRLGPDTPWALLREADLLFLVVRPHIRHLRPALAAIPELAAASQQVELAVCATTPYLSRSVAATLGLPATLALPHDTNGAHTFSDGTPHHHHAHPTALRHTATRLATRLHARLRSPAPRPEGVARDGENTTS